MPVKPVSYANQAELTIPAVQHTQPPLDAHASASGSVAEVGSSEAAKASTATSRLQVGSSAAGDAVKTAKSAASADVVASRAAGAQCECRSQCDRGG